MTHHNPGSHLVFDDLLRAMTDPSDLDPALQAHLKSCLHCQRQTEALTHRYHRLGKMARKMAPEPRQPFRVPARSAPIGRWHFKPGMALGVLGVLIFAFTIWGPRLTRNSQTPAPMVAHNYENDDQMMDEIDALVEDAMPAAYKQLAALSDDRSVEDLDEFINWMVPAPGEEDDVEQPATSSREIGQKPLARAKLVVLAEEGIV
jgi:hypothetical protein